MSRPMMYPLATPAPCDIERVGKISRSEEHHSIVGLEVTSTSPPRPTSTWGWRAEEDEKSKRPTLNVLKKAASNEPYVALPELPHHRSTSSLPALPTRKPHPQRFRELLAFTRPKQWSSWWDIEEDDGDEDDDSYYDPSESSPKSPYQRGTSPAAPTPQEPVRFGPGRHRLQRGAVIFEDAKSPESILSPFAQQARTYGADVIITGKRLRPSTGALCFWKFDQPSPLTLRQQQYQMPEAADATPAGSHLTSGINSAGGSGAHNNNDKVPKKLVWRCPGLAKSAKHSGKTLAAVKEASNASRPRLLGNRRGPQGMATVNTASLTNLGQIHAKSGRSLRPARHLSSTSSAPQLHARGGDLVLAPSRSRCKPAPSAPLCSAGPSVMLTEMSDFDVPENNPRLKAGSPDLWVNRSKLMVVQDLLDGYAADPLSGGPSGMGREDAPADFLQKYVERQQEIERLLELRQGEHAGLSSAGPSVQSAPF